MVPSQASSCATGRVSDGAALMMRAIAESGATAAAPMREVALSEGALLHHLCLGLSARVNSSSPSHLIGRALESYYAHLEISQPGACLCDAPSSHRHTGSVLHHSNAYGLDATEGYLTAFSTDVMQSIMSPHPHPPLQKGQQENHFPMHHMQLWVIDWYGSLPILTRDT